MFSFKANKKDAPPQERKVSAATPPQERKLSSEKGKDSKLATPTMKKDKRLSERGDTVLETSKVCVCVCMMLG